MAKEYVALLKGTIRHLKQQIKGAGPLDKARLEHQLKTTQIELMQETRHKPHTPKQSKQEAADSACDIYRR